MQITTSGTKRLKTFPIGSFCPNLQLWESSLGSGTPLSFHKDHVALAPCSPVPSDAVLSAETSIVPLTPGAKYLVLDLIMLKSFVMSA